MLFECLHFKAMVGTQIDDWGEVKTIAYDVVLEQTGRGFAYTETIARTLGVHGLYMVSVDDEKRSIYTLLAKIN